MKKWTIKANWFVQVCTSVALLVGPGAVTAQPNFPARPLTLIVPFGAGSTTDLYARVLAEGLSSELKQTVVVENRAGAGGSLGIGQALRAPADGYTLMLVTTSSIAINGSLYSSLPYDPAKDISVVGIPAKTPNALIVAASSNAKTFAEFAAMVKDGKQHFYNSQGSGTSQHLSSVLLGQVLQAKLEHVPYKGSEGITGMIGGQTSFGFASLPSVLGLAKGGKVRILAVTGSVPTSAAPDVPTLASLGYKEFANGDVWYGVGVSARVPQDLQAKLADALSAVAEKPTVKTKLKEAGFEEMPPMSTHERTEFVASQVKFWGALVRESGAKID
jgi:tripartite-type tricarboxylate transporter receptor subunit TctC